MIARIKEIAADKNRCAGKKLNIMEGSSYQ
jgi:hypothetical protein